MNDNDMIAGADDDEEQNDTGKAVVEAELARQLDEEQERVSQQEAAEQLLKLNKPTVTTNNNDMITGNDGKEEEAAQHFTEEEEREALIPFLEYLVYGKVPKLKDPIAYSSILARRSIALEEELKLQENEAVNTAKNQDQGMNAWSIHGRSDILLKSVANSFDYQKRIIYIQRSLGFGKKHVVSPLFVPQGLNGVYLCQFRYVVNGKKNGDTSKQELIYCKFFIPILSTKIILLS